MKQVSAFILAAIVTVLLVFSISAFAESDSYLKNVIRLSGYKCDTIDSIQSLMNQNGYHVFCNNFAYHYEVKDVGGMWVVTSK